MEGWKSVILEIFQTGLEWQCSFSIALKNLSLDLKNILILGSYKFLAMMEGKTRKGLFF